jgi:hypothetical protein
MMQIVAEIGHSNMTKIRLGQRAGMAFADIF